MSATNINAELRVLLGKGQRAQIAEELAVVVAAGWGRLVISFEKSEPKFIEPDIRPNFRVNFERGVYEPVTPAPVESPPKADFDTLIPPHWREALLISLQQVMGWGWGKLIIEVERGALRAIYPIQSKRVLPGSKPLRPGALQK